MTGDDHGIGGTAGRFDQYKAPSPPGCSVDDWECIRGTSYIYTGHAGARTRRPPPTTAQGFEVALHVTTNCADWTPASARRRSTSTQLARVRSRAYPSLPPPARNRTHCIVVERLRHAAEGRARARHPLRHELLLLAAAAWMQDRPGLFTGSGMPMRFADVDGTTDRRLPGHDADDRRVGPDLPVHGQHAARQRARTRGATTASSPPTCTPTTPPQPASDAIVASAMARGVPVVSAQQMLDVARRPQRLVVRDRWPGAATRSRSTSMHGAGANGLQAMLPARSAAGPLRRSRATASAVAFDEADGSRASSTRSSRPRRGRTTRSTRRRERSADIAGRHATPRRGTAVRASPGPGEPATTAIASTADGTRPAVQASNRSTASWRSPPTARSVYAGYRLRRARLVHYRASDGTAEQRRRDGHDHASPPARGLTDTTFTAGTSAPGRSMQGLPRSARR